MNTSTKRPAGRPPVAKAMEEIVDTAEARSIPAPTTKIGQFIVVNTMQVKGLRINLEKMRTYSKSDDKVVQIAWDNGLQTMLSYSDKEQADEALALLDKFCL